MEENWTQTYMILEMAETETLAYIPEKINIV